MRILWQGAAVAVAGPGPSGRARLTVAGAPQDALPLVRDARLIDALLRGTPGPVHGGAGFRVDGDGTRGPVTGGTSAPPAVRSPRGGGAWSVREAVPWCSGGSG
ncbi:hypothetical protein [Streptomyces sp. NPDC001508]|uniref:hypothetical protein n=1 Tax=Streptomyces sp. NPDC001508 TaxID=3154656 RepID=UPI00332A9A4C